PALDGSPVIQFDGVSRPYSYTGSNIDRFYDTGFTWTNSLAFSGGNRDQNFRISFTDLRSEGIMPNTGYNRSNVTFNANSKFGKKLTVGAKILYSHEDAERGMRITDSPMNAIQSILRMPPSLNVLDYKGDPNKLGAIPADADQTSLIIWGKVPGEEFQQASNNWGQNPYWVAYQYQQGDIRDRVIASANIRYDITDYLWVQGRIGMDWYTRRNTTITPQGTGYQRGGSINEGERRVRETNADWMLGYDDEFGQFGIHAFVGGNAMIRSNELIQANGNGFNVPFFEAINNAAQQTYSYGFSESGINSLYGSAEISYNNFLFLTATVRNDWFSVLNPDVNDILYPSVGLSWVFSDTWSTMPEWLSFGKVRVSYAQVGNFGG
ncbi:MAG: SusC/RagA family TonB-linked outer membrane protein, partial [Cyclobacteriaceae bacterium]|nr:SusC/RagA family TonB-linked outer membrane protein [Cyclobacteriaceae bacterium]